MERMPNLCVPLRAQIIFPVYSLYNVLLLLVYGLLYILPSRAWKVRPRPYKPVVSERTDAGMVDRQRNEEKKTAHTAT